MKFKKILKKGLEKLANTTERLRLPLAVGIVGSVFLVGNANADRLKICTNNTKPELTNPIVSLYHIEGDSEGWDTHDSTYMNGPNEKEILFYAKNPVVAQTHPLQDPRFEILDRDVRPLDSKSTYTCYFEGENLDNTENVDVRFENNSGDYQGNNVIAKFYDNAGTDSDPNWVDSGTAVDVIEAIKNPSVYYATVPVKNGLSNIVQVSYFDSADTDFSGKVDFKDFNKVAGNWGRFCISEWNPRGVYSVTDNKDVYADINRDGYVGVNDLGALGEKWLDEKPSYEVDQYDPINPSE